VGGVMRNFIFMLAVLILAMPAAAKPTRPPNIIIILADDMGYGDVGAYGQTLIKTPNIDRLAKQGIRLTDYYAPANVCTPSRAGLLTGRYPIRTTLANEVILGNDTNGLPLAEVTIAEALKTAGYATGLIGKWHLGHVAPYWPPRVQGFDQFFGLPYSHDIQPLSLFTDGKEGVEFLKNDKVDLAQLTHQFTDAGIKFIQENNAKPFFLMLAYTAPHQPLLPSSSHKGHSAAFAYGDVMEELDADIGRVLATLKQAGLENDTLVIVTSDNGPWFQGDAGGLHGAKGGAGWDGGYRVPFIARFPGRIPVGGVTNAIAMGIDIFPTALSFANVPLPAGLVLDGKDISSVLAGGKKSPHDHLLLFNNEDIAGIRKQDWKWVERVHYRTFEAPLSYVGGPLLFDMVHDPRERFAANDNRQDVAKAMAALSLSEKARFDPLRTRSIAAPRIKQRSLPAAD
jgi:arylsulfatase A